ncbi:MAG TPA: DNA polymerase IV [Acidimicrobiales bacterium]|jgi:DNA polymerase-4|nr:DNA polymerase IV [Acidimicrobiales bacterium]
MADPDHSSALRPAILHVDLDAFFASVEVLDDPSLRGLPVIVGGDGARGVVASCTYEARRRGVHSAMSSVEAKRRCPDAVFVHGRFSRYEELSTAFHEVLHSATPLVESLGLDEAFLDVTGSVAILGTPVEIAGAIRARVRDELALSCCVGVARKKLFAKLASRRAKPVASASGITEGRGVVVTMPEDEPAVLASLRLRDLWGVGPATAAKLERLGIASVAELAAIEPDLLAAHLGRASADRLSELANGIDERPVEVGQGAKSIGHEETFAVSVTAHDELRRHARRMGGAVARALRAAGLRARCVTLKVKFDDFSIVTRSHTVEFGVDDDEAVAQLAAHLVDDVPFRGGIRLCGVAASSLESGDVALQLAFTLDDPIAARRVVDVAARQRQGDLAALRGAIDELRRRHGASAVATVAELGPDGLRVEPRRREDAWGPAGETG